MKAIANTQQQSRNCEKVCPIVYAINLIGQKWKIPILWHITEHGSLRYNELKRLTAPITNTALTRNLRELESHGLINRHNFNTVPPSVAYSLTERGNSLQPALRELFRWGEAQIEYNLK